MAEMKNFTTLELAKELALAFGPSGCEEDVAKIIIEYLTPYADEISRDGMGSVIAVYKKRAASDEYDPNREPDTPSGTPDVTRLMLSAPMDEPGFMIKSIDSDGYLKIASLCGRDPKILTARNVTVGDEDRKTIGYVGVKPTHLGGSGDFDSLYVDIGAKDKDDALVHVEIGDFGAYRSDFVRFGKDDSLIKCKALDSRLGGAVLCSTLKHLSESGAVLPFDVYFAFTCRDEITRSSAGGAARKIAPDVAILVRGESVNDTAGDTYTASAKLGGGATMSLMDRGTLYDRELYTSILDVAKAEGIPAQVKQYVSDATGSAQINRALEGVRCAEISIPIRYSRTAACVASVHDLEATEKLTRAVIREWAKSC